MPNAWVTLRARTTLLVSLVTGLALIAGAVALLLTLQSQLTGSGDALAQARVNDLLAGAAAGELPATLDSLDDESVAQVIDPRGVVLAASGNVVGRAPLTEVRGGGDLEVLTIEGPDDDETERYRVWLAAGPSESGPVTVLVGTSLESVTEATRTLREALLVGVPLLLLLVASATWMIVGRALRRIDAITVAVDEIGESELHRRVPEHEVADEVGRLAETMNRMLARLEEAAVRQRAFVADASHDLQSPLAALRAQLDVARAHPDRYDVPMLALELQASSAELEQLVGDLLFLAVQDDGQQEPARALLDLDDLVLEESLRVRSGADVRVDTGGVSAAPVVGDASELRRLVRNLLDNAVRHAASTVTVTLSSSAAGVVLEVADDGPGIAEVDRARVFDRFYRGDASRSRQGSSGLGLAIAAGVARRHGGELRLLDGPGGHLQLWLPLPG